MSRRVETVIPAWCYLASNQSRGCRYSSRGPSSRRLGFHPNQKRRNHNRRETLKLFRTLTAAGVIAAAAVGSAAALDISGAGATFPYPIYAKWADVYKKETG